jgi:hypothetical protein
MERLDGIDWLTVDEAYSAQLAEKERLIAEHADDVLVCRPEAEEAAAELLAEVLTLLASRSDFEVASDWVRRADGETIDLDASAPLKTLSRLIQEDLCILQKQGETHALTAALLCFPASWRLREKMGRGLPAIHGPVAEYDANIASRVQRLFDGLRVGHPIWRANLLRYEDAALFQPLGESEKRKYCAKTALYERSERQTLWRLPRSGAIVFSIHTCVFLANPD